MTKVTSLLFFVLMLCVFASANLKAQDKESVKKPAEDKKPPEVDVTGTWNVEIEVAGQSGEPVFSLQQKGNKIAGKYKGLLGEYDVIGKISGEKIEFEFTTDQGKVVYTGTIANDAMKGEAQYGDSFSGKWTAKRSIDVTGKIENVAVTTVPEPGVMVSLVTMLLGVGLWGRKSLFSVRRRRT